MVKKVYTTPEVKTYGDVKSITATGTLKQFASPNDGFTYEGKDMQDCSKCA